MDEEWLYACPVDARGWYWCFEDAPEERVPVWRLPRRCEAREGVTYDFAVWDFEDIADEIGVEVPEGLDIEALAYIRQGVEVGTRASEWIDLLGWIEARRGPQPDGPWGVVCRIIRTVLRVALDLQGDVWVEQRGSALMRPLRDLRDEGHLDRAGVTPREFDTVEGVVLWASLRVPSAEWAACRGPGGLAALRVGVETWIRAGAEEAEHVSTT